MDEIAIEEKVKSDVVRNIEKRIELLKDLKKVFLTDLNEMQNNLNIIQNKLIDTEARINELILLIK